MNIPAGQENAFPAFYQGPTTGPEVYYGLTIRDYFAAKAMSGWLASFDPNDGIPSKEVGQKQIAEMAYSIADAMLETRKKI